ncbi:hypothetical protein NXX53_06135 [Bacteroides salyersiae]|uniref:hypothetical protein n=1 Tax=uncultured Bacteroides sp. TaxID=162156 RepID=UPI0025E23C76|nr:hypothetical protein [uncultured Bacteroides sp.]MCS2956854.1 hypothetical protein [Bacteroides salyersiae]
MTVLDFLKQNKPFFHVTPSYRMAEIFEKGLENRVNSVVNRPVGICVTRLNDPDMWIYIADHYLNERIDGVSVRDFTVIQINPHDFCLQPKTILRDIADEPLSYAFNYINRPNLNIRKEDIIWEFKIPDGIEITRINLKFNDFIPEQLEY